MDEEMPFEYDPDVWKHIHSYSDVELLDGAERFSRGNELDPDISWGQYLLHELWERYGVLADRLKREAAYNDDLATALDTVQTAWSNTSENRDQISRVIEACVDLPLSSRLLIADAILSARGIPTTKETEQ